MYRCENMYPLQGNNLDWSRNSSLECNRISDSSNLESVLDNLKESNVSESSWSDYIQAWIDSVCYKQEEHDFGSDSVHGVGHMLQQYWFVKNQERYADILEKIDVLILCGILENCCSAVDATNLVNQVLYCIYESNPMVFNSYFDLTGKNRTEYYNEINRQRLAFFLWHTNKARTLFNGHRLIESILFSVSEDDNCCFPLEPLRVKPESKILQTILSYGTFDLAATDKDFKDKSLSSFPVFHMFRDILTDMYFCCYSRNGAVPSCILARQPQFKDALISLQLILRSTSRIPRSFLDNPQFWPNTRWGKYNFNVIINHFLSCDQLPSLKDRLNQPASLQQACRISIRQRLYQNWHLSDGINKLGLPETLCGYLELKID